MDTIAVCTKLAIAVEMLEKIEAGPICALSARSRNTLGWRPRWAGAGDEIPVSIVYALRRDRVDVFRKTADAETPRGSKSRLGSISRHDFQFSPTNKLVAGASELQDIENYRA